MLDLAGVLSRSDDTVRGGRIGVARGHEAQHSALQLDRTRGVCGARLHGRIGAAAVQGDGRHSWRGERRRRRQGKNSSPAPARNRPRKPLSERKRAAALGYEVALVKTPYYYKPAYKPEVLIAHYRRVADESPIPVLLYSVPIFTGLALEAPETIALAEHQNIIGIKDSSGNVQRISEMIAGAPAQFQVLVGAAATVFPCLAVGARWGHSGVGQRTS